MINRFLIIDRDYEYTEIKCLQCNGTFKTQDTDYQHCPRCGVAIQSTIEPSRDRSLMRMRVDQVEHNRKVTMVRNSRYWIKICGRPYEGGPWYPVAEFGSLRMTGAHEMKRAIDRYRSGGSPLRFGSFLIATSADGSGHMIKGSERPPVENKNA